MKIAFGCDHGGYVIKDEVLNYFMQNDYEVVYAGTFTPDSCDYPDYASKVCEEVVAGNVDFGVLICGTGIGMSIVANKIPGIRCAHVNDEFSAEATRLHNDTNVIALGARIATAEQIIKYIDVFLNTKFSGEKRHVERISKITEIEKIYLK